MVLTINGKRDELPLACTVAELIQRRGLMPDHVVVELNQRIIENEKYSATMLRDGDRLELLSFVGGG